MFGNVSMRKEALNQLGFWDAKEREGALSLVEAVARKTKREIKEGVVGAFKTLLSKEGDWRPSIDAMPFEILDDQEARKLEEIFTEEEVFGALSKLNGDKAPCPDSFSMA
ncbi:hypothetical protein CK203_011046 [Vitis vinifera]|uniref:Uncharacterized protein n=1 Tax=Vitis vinifera TaxID=29760 RepID=A0A438JIM4_VITVI|nr:hypothetical protein CK203_011046 [Vitis vinifera]